VLETSTGEVLWHGRPRDVLPTAVDFVSENRVVVGGLDGHWAFVDTP
jgi:hypothetical protein